MYKRFLAGLLVITTLFTSISFPEPVGATQNKGEKAAITNDVNVQGSNSFGNLFAEALSEEAEEQEANNGCNVFSIEMNDATAIVTFETVMDCTLVVGVYDDAGTKMLAAGSTEVYAGETMAALDIETNSMPQYFYLRVFLVETETLRPLSTAFESPLYTQEMQEFLSKTTDDFEQEKVLNLDEDKANNFVVYGEDTIIIRPTEGVNEVLSVDIENEKYVFGNADAAITSLKAGDIFSYEYGTGELLIVKVASISIDGTTVTIMGADTSMEEVFDYVRIEGEMGVEDAEIDDSTCSEGVTYNGLVDAEEQSDVQTYADAEVDVKVLAFDLKAEFLEEDLATNIDLTGSLTLTFDSSVKYYAADGLNYLELKMDYSAEVEVTLTGKLSPTLSLAKFRFGFLVCGVVLEFTPSIVFEFSGGTSAKGTLSGTVGILVASDMKVTNLTTEPIFALDAEYEQKLEGKIFVGLSLAPKLKIISDKVAYTEMEFKGGAELEVELLVIEIGSKEKLVKHDCEKCLDGNINAKFTLAIEGALANNPKSKYKLTLADITVKMFDFYYSLDKGEFGLSECPYLLCLTTIKVTDIKGAPLSDVTIQGVEKKTDAAGRIKLYLPAGTTRVDAQKEGYLNSGKTFYVQAGIENYASVKLRKQGESIATLEGQKVRNGAVAGGSAYAGGAAVTDDGRLYTWGSGFVTGTGSSSEIWVPVQILENEEIAQVALGGGRAMAVTTSGSLYEWGNTYLDAEGSMSTNYEPVQLLKKEEVVQIAQGVEAEKSAAVTKDGKLYLWGNNYDSYFVGSTTDKFVSEPLQVFNKYKIAKVELGYDHYAFITEDGSLYTWGKNQYGQLGAGHYNIYANQSEPVKILDNVAQVSLGMYQSAAVTKDGKLYLWGYGGSLFLENNQNPTNYTEPIKIMDGVKQVELANSCFAIVKTDGSLWTWGYNYNGQVGDGTYENRYSERVKIMDNVVQVSLAHANGMAVTTSGDLYTWGSNFDGQLGNGDTGNGTPTPICLTNPARNVAVMGLSDVELMYVPEFLASKAIEITDNEGTTSQTASFIELLPNEIYNFYIMQSKVAENLYGAENLLYIGQGISDESGNMSIVFEAKEAYEGAEIFVIGNAKADIAKAAIGIENIVYDGTMQYVHPQIQMGSVLLEEGKDYFVTEGYSATEIGKYTLKISGIGLYFGEVTATYNVVCVHDYEEIHREPTCACDGEDTLKCKICGHTETEVIEALGHKYIIMNPGMGDLTGAIKYMMWRCEVCHHLKKVFIR